MPVDDVSDNGPFFSPDGEWLGFDGSGGLYRVPTRGGSALTLGPDNVRGASWGTDDEIVLGSIGGGLSRVSVRGGELEALTTPDPEQGESTHAWPFIIPDRRAVLFVIATGTPLSTGEVAVLELDTREVTRLGLAGVGPRYVSTGHLVYVTADGSLRAVPFDATRLAVTGNAVSMVEGVAVLSTGAAHYGISDDGRLVYGTHAEAQRTPVWVGRDGTEEPIDVPLREYLSANISPDGTQLALGIMTQGNDDIWTRDVRTRTLQRLTSDPAEDRAGHWTPDGERILFGSDRENQRGLYSKAADGTGPIELLWSGDGSRRGMSASTPDGTHLIRTRAGDIVTVLGLIRFRGRSLKGDYDVHDGDSNEWPATTPAV